MFHWRRLGSVLVQSGRAAQAGSLRAAWRASVEVAGLQAGEVFRNRRSVHCPVCGWKGNRFYPMFDGRHVRPGALCPRCGSFERHRLFHVFLARRTDVFQRPMELLDVAPSRGLRDCFLRSPNINYLSIDPESPLAMRKENLTRLTFPEGSFDAVICLHVLEHIEDDARAIAEVYRVLRPGATAYLQSAWDENMETAREFGRADPAESGHWRLYGRDLVHRVTAAGFAVRLDRFAFDLPLGEIARLGVVPESILVARKPQAE